jgi:sister chromatid cohesion protein DCC1
MVNPDQNSASTPPIPSPQAAPTPPGQLAGLATQAELHAEASNQFPVIVSAIVKSHFELVQVAPRLHALDAALQDRPIGSLEEEENADHIAQPMDTDINNNSTTFISTSEQSTALGKTWEELLSLVQASSEELAAALTERNAVCINRKWRGIDPNHLGTLLELILLTAVEKGWSLDAVPAVEAGEVLAPHGFLPELTEHCLKIFSKPVLRSSSSRGIGNGGDDTTTINADKDGDENENGRKKEGVYAVHAEAVCRHFGLKLLREKQRWDDVNEFEATWRASVPEGMTPSFDLLRGEALVDGDAQAGSTGRLGVQLLRVADLPPKAGERFKFLFSIRPRWELPALEPYIENLPGPGETTEALLLKFARASQQKPTDPVTYSSRF